MKKILIPIIIILCLAGGGYALWNSLDAKVFSTDVFPQKTTINGVDCSGLTTEKAKDKLVKEWNSKTFTFTSDGSKLGTVSDFDFTYDIDDTLASLKKDHFFKSALNHYFGQAFDVNMNMTVKTVNKSFKKQLKKADYLTEKDPTKTKDAYIDLESEDFAIVPEVYGNNTDYDLLIKKVTALIAKNELSMEFVKSAFYKQPEITADSEEIKERQKFCKQYFSSKITYLFGTKEVKIPPKEMEKMLDVKITEKTESEESSDTKSTDETTAAQDTSQGLTAEISVREDAVREYVVSLGEKYNTVGIKRTIKSLTGKTYDISGGDYGYAIYTDKETKKLIKNLKSGKTIKREPVWLSEGFVPYGQEDDIGDTYVDISLSDQHLYYFKNGKKVVDCPVVTGNVAQGYGTPSGVFGLSYKERDATLKGSNADGSSYESPVSCWMPFYGNYGMHDASWRSAFGGSIYRGNGSHGCVNMPVASAKTLFNNLADKNVPIIVHW